MVSSAAPLRSSSILAVTTNAGWVRIERQALGLSGSRLPLPQNQRPACGAQNRQGKPCSVKVEPGKRRCRFHGGLSTGPKSEEGRARIAEAQRRRWAALREPPGEACDGSPDH
jgi:hypothetical protein